QTAIAKIHGVVSSKNGVIYNDPSLRIAPRGQALAQLGLTPQNIGEAVAALAQGTVATNLAGNTHLIPVRVKVKGVNPPADKLASASLYANGQTTSLGDLATVTPVRLASDVYAENGQLLLRVTGNIAGAPLSAVTSSIKSALANIQFPPGYSAEIGGEAQTQAQSFKEFVIVIGFAIVLVFAVMLATFSSFRLPLVILTTIPLSLIGVALALLLTGTPINVSSFMGLLLLVGVVVKNGILLIDVANKHGADGASVEDSLVAAGKTRLRPIVMTTLAAIGGLLPLALGIGTGAEMEKPLAIAVIGGLSTATIFTLLIIPVMYATFVGNSRPSVAAAKAA
ncbi:MAG: efflux RND transporter permease subunit, partial [Vulcanimicrobiaceae bacterium]